MTVQNSNVGIQEKIVKKCHGHRQHSNTNKQQRAVINDAPQQNQLLYPL